MNKDKISKMDHGESLAPSHRCVSNHLHHYITKEGMLGSHKDGTH